MYIIDLTSQSNFFPSLYSFSIKICVFMKFKKKMDRNVLHTNLIKENLVIVPTAPPRYTITDYAFDARQKNRVSEDQQSLADRVLQ